MLCMEAIEDKSLNFSNIVIENLLTRKSTLVIKFEECSRKKKAESHKAFN